MIFCRRCGRYSAEPASACEACGADLKIAGHTSFQGGAVKVGSVAKAVSGGGGTGLGLALAPEPAPKVVPEPSPEPASAMGLQALPETDAAAEKQMESLPEAAAPTTAGHPLFNHDKFLLRQKAIAINEKYYVTDEAGTPIVFVERPALLTQQIIMLAGVAIVFFGGTFLISFVSGFFGTLLGETLNQVAGLVGFIAIVVLTILTWVALIPKRHVTFYTDDSKTEKLLEIKQLNKIEFPNANFTILDENGNPLGKLRKNVLFDYVRRRWYCMNHNSLQLFVAKEDSIILSLLRRTIPLLQFMRTNFIFLRGDEVIGEFNRKLTILDRYVLDMTLDPNHTVDRRIALALAVMLDTGERR